MIKSTCPSCNSIIEIDETGCAVGDILEVECPMCGISIEVQVPNNALVEVNTDAEVLVSDSNTLPQSQMSQKFGQDHQIIQMQLELERLKAQTAAATAIAAQATAKASEVQNRQPQEAYSMPTKVQGKDKVTAVLLAFFLGGFGAHKFYLGNIGMGVIYLIFCWTYIPSVLAFVEGIIYACTDSNEFARKYPK